MSVKYLGLKFDSGKLLWHLLPWKPLEEVVKVMTFGAEKYEENSWQCVKPTVRYLDAAHRHIFAYETGEMYDGESKIHHLAHAVCCLLFLIWFDLFDKGKKG